MFSLGSDRIFSILLICLSVIGFVIIGGGEEVTQPGGLNAATYPRVLLIMLTVCALAHIISKHSGKNKSSFFVKELITIVIVLVYILLLGYIGYYFILTPIVLFVLPVIYGYHKYGVIILSITLIMLFLYAVFSLILNIPLP